MNRGVVLFWCLFVGILVFAFGVQFAYSQTGGFATTQPSSGVSHTANQIVCDNCISSGNIADGAVTGTDISDASIGDVDIGVGAGIFSRKINGANGWHFTTGVMPVIDTWYPAISTDLTAGSGAGVMGMTSWSNAIVELTCDPAGFVSPSTIISNGIRKYGGIDFLNLYRFTDIITPVSNSMNFGPYIARNSANTFSQSLLVRSSSGGQSLEFSRGYVGTSPNYPAGFGSLTGTPIEPQAQAFECVVKVLSLCSGGPGDHASCGP